MRSFSKKAKNPDIREFFLTDYSILLKKKKHIKKYLSRYYGHKKFLYFLNNFVKVLDEYYNQRH